MSADNHSVTRPPHKLKRRHDGTLHRQRRRLTEQEIFVHENYGREFMETRCHGFIQFNADREIYMKAYFDSLRAMNLRMTAASAELVAEMQNWETP